MHAPTHASEASPAGGCTRARDDRGVAPTMRVYVTARGYGSVFTVTDGWISTDGRANQPIIKREQLASLGVCQVVQVNGRSIAREGRARDPAGVSLMLDPYGRIRPAAAGSIGRRRRGGGTPISVRSCISGPAHACAS